MADTLTIEETMEKLSVTRPTVMKLIKDGKIRATQAGVKWLVSKQSVREFLGDKPTLEELIRGGN